MEHKEAIRIQASDRYLLGELPATERDAFEEHFFECAICAEDVQFGAVLADNSKAVFTDPSFRQATAAPDKRRSEKWAWLRFPQLIPVGAALAFAAFSGVEAVEIAHLRQPRVVSAAVIPAASKGDIRVIQAKANEPFVQLWFNVDAIDSPGPYRCSLLSESGKQLFSLVAPAPKPGEPLAIQLPSTSLAPGRYTMILRAPIAGGAERDVDRYPFTLEKN
jgi:Putative zinc-finger